VGRRKLTSIAKTREFRIIKVHEAFACLEILNCILFIWIIFETTIVKPNHVQESITIEMIYLREQQHAFLQVLSAGIRFIKS
jgi:hypothetical protein